MARVTIEDCLVHVPNRFDLVLLASKRARQLLAGAEPLVPINDDKATVLALREIAAGLIDLEALAKDDPKKKTKKEEAYAGEKLDVETQDLMNEEINLPGVRESESEFSDDEDFADLMATPPPPAATTVTAEAMLDDTITEVTPGALEDA